MLKISFAIISVGTGAIYYFKIWPELQTLHAGVAIVSGVIFLIMVFGPLIKVMFPNRRNVIYGC